MQRAGQHTFAVEAPLDTLAHGVPHLGKIIPYLRAFALLYIFPVGTAGALTPVENLGKGVHVIHIIARCKRFSLFGKLSASHTEHRPIGSNVTFAVKGFKKHSVGMERQEYLWLPHYLNRCGRT